MKNLVWILLIILIGCTSAPVKKGVSDNQNTSVLTKEALDKELDSLTAEGEYCLVRGSDREYDTIIDHIRYRFVKDLGQDTPIDSLKHIANE